MERDRLNRTGAVAGALGVLGNIVGVAVLREIPAAYRPEAIGAWTDQVLRAPVAASISGLAFTLGLVALALWAVAMGARLRTAAAWTGAGLLAIGAVLNAAGTPAPVVVVHLLTPACGEASACHEVSMALLGSSLALDALFNLLLGIGLILLGGAIRTSTWPSWLAWLSIAAGIASMPVSLQAVSPLGADLLMIAGPLWLVTIAVCSVRLWREPT